MRRLPPLGACAARPPFRRLHAGRVSSVAADRDARARACRGCLRPGSCRSSRRRRPSTRSTTSSPRRRSETSHGRALRVPDRVGERLLRDAVDRQLDLVVERRQRRRRPSSSTVDPRAALDARAERREGAREPEVVERRRAQLVADPAHLLEALARQLLGVGQRLRLARRRSARAPASARARPRSGSGRSGRAAPARSGAARPPGRPAPGACSTAARPRAGRASS